jgi:alkanesulfonate monooxygenase SsuD/methylene tetrahydromethanopterin reductase-like flavin-dependent oxidoreductase (luciferase family)
MNIGVVFPQVEIGQDPSAIRDYAQAVEALGYTHILAFDHVLGANPERPGGWKGPYTYRHDFHEPLVLFGFLAGVTSRIGLVTGILILPQRQAALVAKQAAAVDVLSAGRLRLGVGVGWNAVEFEALNENFKNRGKRIEEQIEVMRALWEKELVTFNSQWHHIPTPGSNRCLHSVRSRSGWAARVLSCWSGPHAWRTVGCRTSVRAPRRRPSWTSSTARSGRLDATP